MQTSLDCCQRHSCRLMCARRIQHSCRAVYFSAILDTHTGDWAPGYWPHGCKNCRSIGYWTHKHIQLFSIQFSISQQSETMKSAHASLRGVGTSLRNFAPSRLRSWQTSVGYIGTWMTEHQTTMFTCQFHLHLGFCNVFLRIDHMFVNTRRS